MVSMDWGGGFLHAKSMTSQRNRAVTRWRICVTMAMLFYVFNSTVID